MGKRKSLRHLDLPNNSYAIPEAGHTADVCRNCYVRNECAEMIPLNLKIDRYEMARYWMCMIAVHGNDMACLFSGGC